MAPRWLTEDELRARWTDARVDGWANRGEGIPAAGVVVAAIEQAETRVESSLLSRYAAADLPTTTGATSPALKQIVGSIAPWFLSQAYDQVGADVERAWIDGLAQLRDVVRGGASLVLESEPEADQVRAQILANKTAADATFTRDAMADW